jgi:hypothetical protein
MPCTLTTACKHRHRLYPHYKSRKPIEPEGGWTQEAFNTRNGQALVRACASTRANAIAMRMRDVMQFLDVCFREQLEEVILLAERYHGVKAAGTANELTLWYRAIRNGVNKGMPKMVEGMVNRLDRSGRRVLWDTARLLGMKAKDIDSRLFKADSAEIVKRLTGLAKTTKKRLAGSVAQAIKDQLTVKQTTAKLRKMYPQLSESRIRTIARTELSRAADAGARKAYRQYGKVTHVSVIGCKHVEPNIPEFRGIPTCNIKHVPEADSDELQFHINHTGMLVPSGFRRRDGSVPNLRLQRGRGLED